MFWCMILMMNIRILFVSYLVKKEFGCDSCGAICIEILDVLIDSDVMAIYLDQTHAAYANNENLNQPIDSKVIGTSASEDDFNDSSSPINDFPFKSSCSILYEFIDDTEVRKLSDLCGSEDCANSIVVV
ncbi:hypothetical protein TSUD_268070 [Trifolium subterraneum]|uniref:Uncharacterized protein n=1 Tax=Trifolium subterraneum TaxID=3900 RepID=A0A2Z6NAZ8_TRISU|nr:hypothetical protein TSUD_268070 [Trifolium subterraneum]